MNYIRGAVSAISAPYQYYKDLPPLNPATLTGAIDVIVIRIPTDGGEYELRCSPFHVRFGKWQVLRPGDKKVRPRLRPTRALNLTRAMPRSTSPSTAARYPTA
jgi:phosphatidate phosphatase PAH1